MPKYLEVLIIISAIFSSLAAFVSSFVALDILKRRAQSRTRQSAKEEKELEDAFQGFMEQLYKFFEEFSYPDWKVSWPTIQTYVVSFQLGLRLEVSKTKGKLRIILTDTRPGFGGGQNNGYSRTFEDEWASEDALQELRRLFSSMRAA